MVTRWLQWWRTSGPDRRLGWARWSRRSLRTLLLVAAATVTLLALAVVAVLSSSAVREKLFMVGLDAGAGAFPGVVDVGNVQWPEPGHLRLRDVVWREGGDRPDELARVAVLDCRLDLQALWSRDIRVDSLRAVVPWLDGPAIGRVLRPQRPALKDTVDVGVTRSQTFVRSGVVPELPSLGVDHWRLELGQLVVGARATLSNVIGVGRLEAGRGRSGRAVVDHLALDLVAAAADSSRPPEVLSLRHLGAGFSLIDDGKSAPSADRFEATLDSMTIQFAAAGLLPGVAGVDSSAADGGEAVVNLRQTGRISRADRIVQAELVSDFELPFAGEWRSGLPAGFAAARFDRISGRHVLTAAYGDSWFELTADLDLATTPWLDAGRLRARAGAHPDTWSAGNWRSAAVILDTLAISLLGTQLQAGGSLRQDQLELDLSVVADDARLAMLIRPDFMADAAATLDLDSLAVRMHLTGAAGDTVSGTYAADFVLPGAADLKPFLPADFPHDKFGPVTGHLALSGVYRRSLLDLTVDLDLQPTRWLDAGRLSLRCLADPKHLASGRLSGATIELDTLALVLPGHALRARGALRPDSLDLSLQAGVDEPWLAALMRPDVDADSELSLDLEAKLGGTLEHPSLAANLRGDVQAFGLQASPLAIDLAGDANGAQISLRFPDGIAVADVALDSLVVRAQATRAGADSLRGTFAVAAHRGGERLRFGGRAWSEMPGNTAGRRVRLDSLVIGSDTRQMRLNAPTTIDLGPGPLELAVTPMILAGDAGEVRLGGHTDTTGLDLSGRLNLLLSAGLLDRVAPGEIWTASGGHDLALDAVADLDGTRENPRLAGRLGARLVPRNGDSDLGVDVAFDLATRDSAGLRADLALVAADSVLLNGRVFLPGNVDAHTRQWRHAPDQAARAVIPEQTLKTALFGRLLPPEVSVSGPVTIGADLAVPLSGTDSGSTAPDLWREVGTVKGRLRGPRLEVKMPNRSRLVLGADLKLGGKLAAPRLEGQVVVNSGFLRIPEIPRNLHPTAGDPLLWKLAADDSVHSAAGRPLVFEPTVASGPTVSGARPPVLPDLDLEIEIPGNLRLYGYGLDVELAGDIQVGRGYDAEDLPRPRLQGAIQSVHGTLRFMNRVFTVEKSEIRFRGVVPVDPELDMVLVANVGGTVVRILVTGTATDPVIALTSEPDYEESDIMAVLLFGQPLRELDNDQRGSVGEETGAAQQLRQNLAGLAVVFGTAGLQNRVSSTVGVDMVEVGSDSQGGSTLMVGKFINPRLMLKYHYSLEKSGTYFLTMEYALNQLFKVVSTYGQGEEDSGLELKWSRRY